MDETYGEHHLLGNGHRLDLASVLGMVVLRREDGSEVSRFSVRDATSKAIEQAAEADYRAQLKLAVAGSALFYRILLRAATIVIDGQINTPRMREMSPEREEHTMLSPGAIGETYWQLHSQDRTA